MMDLKEIIKWFIPCFHILLVILKVKMDRRMTYFCLFILFNFNVSSVQCANENIIDVSKSNVVYGAKYLDSNLVKQIENHSDIISINESMVRSGYDIENDVTGRTFGRPFKKMMTALLPLVFQIGAASTWAVIAAIVGVKTLFVALVILKLLLVAGAAKVGALFATKTHDHHGWQPPHQKEIHLHIHNGHGVETQHPGYEEHIAAPPWSRDGAAVQPVALDPYAAGPQTISTPFGNYVKINT